VELTVLKFDHKVFKLHAFRAIFLVPLQKIRAFYRIVEILHNKVIWVIKLGVK